MTASPPPARDPDSPPIVDQLTSAMERLGIRRTADGWVAGVCDGIAWRWGIDPVVVRVAVIVLALFGGFGIALYAVGWLLLPAPDGPSILRRIAASAGQQVALLALAGLALGVIAVSGQGLSDPQGWGLSQLLLLLIIGGIGYAAIRSRSGQGGDGAAPPEPGATAPDAGTPVGGEPEAGTSTVWPPIARRATQPETRPALPDPVWPDPTSPVSTPAAAPAPFAPTQQVSPAPRPGPVGTAIPSPAWPQHSRPAATCLPPPVAPRPRRRRLSAWVALTLAGLALVVATVAATVHGTQGAAGSSVTVGLATALAFVATALLIAGVSGRRGGLTTVLALLLAVATGASAMASNPAWAGGVGERTWGASAGPARYRLGAGSATLNLDEPVPAQQDRLAFPVRLGVGELVINLPTRGTTTVTVDARVGSVSEDGDTVASDDRLRFTRTYGAGEPEFVVDVTMTAGEVRIEGVRK